MNGFELLKRVREHEGSFADIPFVFLSALADKDQIVEGKVLGADDYVIKPVDFDLLFATLAARVRQVERMKQRKEKDMVALYKALSLGDETNNEEKIGLEEKPTPIPVPITPSNSSPIVVNEPVISSAPPKRPATGKMVTGRFQLLGLENLKAKLEKDADKHFAMLQTVIQNVIYKSLSSEDVCKVADDGQMMICFANLSEDEAAYKLEAIKKEIWVKIVGEEDYEEELKINSQVFEIEVEEEEYNNAPDPWEIIQNRINNAAASAQERVDIFVQDILERAEVRFKKLQKPNGSPLPISIATFDTFGQRKLRNINQVIDNTDLRCLIIEGGYIGQTVAYMISNLSDMAAGVIVNFSYQLCINKREFEKSLTLLEKLTPVARERMIIAVTDIPKKLHLSQLSDIMMRLRPFSKMRMTEFQLEMPGDPSFEMVGASILMLDYFEALALLKHSKSKFIQSVKTLKLKKKKLLITNTPSNKTENCAKFGADFVHLRNDEI